MSMYFSKNL